MLLTMMAVLGLAGATGTAPLPASDPAAPKQICKRISDSPTERLAPKRKVCMTAAQWKQARRSGAVEMPKPQGTPGRY